MKEPSLLDQAIFIFYANGRDENAIAAWFETLTDEQQEQYVRELTEFLNELLGWGGD